jgi:hypothetical protein
MKPSLSADTSSADWRQKVRTLIDLAFGRRENRIAAPAEMIAGPAAGAAPTKAEFDALLTDVQNLRATVVAYHARFDEE